MTNAVLLFMPGGRSFRSFLEDLPAEESETSAGGPFGVASSVSMTSMMFELAEILPQRIPYETAPADGWESVRIVVEGAPVSLTFEFVRIGVVIEGELDDGLALRLAEEIRANIEATTGEAMYSRATPRVIPEDSI